MNTKRSAFVGALLALVAVAAVHWGLPDATAQPLASTQTTAFVEVNSDTTRSNPTRCKKPDSSAQTFSELLGTAWRHVLGTVGRLGWLDTTAIRVQMNCELTAPATVKDFPHIWVLASIAEVNTLVTNTVNCVAVRVGPRVLLTAAHCVEDGTHYKAGDSFEKQLADVTCKHAAGFKEVLPGALETELSKCGPGKTCEAAVDVALCTATADLPGSSAPFETVSRSPPPLMELTGVGTDGCSGQELHALRQAAVPASAPASNASTGIGRHLVQVKKEPVCASDSGAPWFTDAHSTRRLVAIHKGFSNTTGVAVPLSAPGVDALLKSATGVCGKDLAASQPPCR